MNEEAFLHRYRFFIFAAILALIMGVQSAPAQTAANITIISGSGQIFCSCPLAVGGGQLGFLPMVVKVTDAQGNAVANASVTWEVTLAPLASPALASGSVGTDPANGNQTWTTTTATDGTTQNSLALPGGGFGTTSTPPTEMQVRAMVPNGATVTFSETQAYNASGGSGQISEVSSNLPAANSQSPLVAVSGQQGYTYNGQVGQGLNLGVLTASGTPVPGVSVRIANFQTSPIATCATGPGADPGSVLTDPTGYATCNPVFSGSGPGTFILVIGGVTDPTKIASPQIGDLLTYYLNVPPPMAFQVTAVVPGSINVVSGSGQSASSGQALTGTLNATVFAQGGGTLAGQSVTWSANPSSAATLANATTTSDINGNVTNSLVFSNNASGTITVTAVLTSNPNIKATFTETAVPVVTAGALSKVSGNSQTALVGTTFSAPLIVQLTANNGTLVANYPVTFSATGGAILSTTQTNTGSNGQALVTVTAPSAAGAFTVTASAAGFSQTFNLIATPPGPTLTTGSFSNGADGRIGSISPCALASISGTGLAQGPGINTNNPFGLGALSNSVASDTITFGGTQAPILSVSNVSGLQQITFQVPCTASTGSNQVTVSVGGGNAATSVNVLPASPGVFQTNTILAVSSGATYPVGVFVRPDGTFVSQSNAARKGEVIVAYATGLGQASPSVGTNALPLPTAISNPTSTIIVGIANAGVPVVSAQLSSDVVGVYKVSFQIPTSSPSGTQVFSLGVSAGGQNYYSAGSAIPIQ